MKIRTAIAIACIALFGFVQTAEARRHHVRLHVRHAVKNTSGGTSVSTTDVTGDGSSDVVVTTKPKRKPK